MTSRQLMMRRYHLNELPPVKLQAGCGIRSYRPGDEEVWGRIMNTGIDSGWTLEKVMEQLTGRPQFDPGGLFFATIDGEPVGSACAWRSSPDERRIGIVHMVCVLPEARGRNLGYLVTLRVLHYFRDRGFEESVLTTDDFRLPAIKAYLRLGFKPFHRDLTQFHRWNTVLAMAETG